MKVARWGNSLAVRIPKDVADALGLHEGVEVDFVPLEKGLGLAVRMTREEAIEGLRAFRDTMPADYRFDRDEANGR